jgi:hypothetical protein
VDTGGDHHWLVLHIGGRKSSIRTKLSRGSMDYGDDLLAMVRRQLRLASQRDLLRLLDCPMDGAEYVRLLQDNGALPADAG